jgi:hypothetical protein
MSLILNSLLRLQYIKSSQQSMRIKNQIVRMKNRSFPSFLVRSQNQTLRLRLVMPSMFRQKLKTSQHSLMRFPLSKSSKKNKLTIPKSLSISWPTLSRLVQTKCKSLNQSRLLPSPMVPKKMISSSLALKRQQKLLLKLP